MIDESAPRGDRQDRDLAILMTTSQIFNEALDLDEAMRRVVELLAVKLDCLISLWVPDPPHEMLALRETYHPDPARLEDLRIFLREHPLALKGSLTGRAFLTRQDLLVPDTFTEAEFSAVYREELGLKSFLTTTIFSRGEILGMLSAARDTSQRPFVDRDLAVVRAVADQASNAMAQFRLLAAEVRLRQRAEILLKIATSLRSELALPAVLQDAVDVTWQFLRPDFVGIFLLDEHHRFYLAATTDLDVRAQVPRWPAADPDSFLGRILRAMTPVHVAQLDSELMLDAERQFVRPDAKASCSAVPLLHQGTPNGVLLLLWRSVEAAQETEDLELATGIGELIALALENQRLVQQEAATHSARLLAERVALEREALIRQIVHDLRNSTQAISLINEEIELASQDQPGILLGVAAIDRQITFISSFLKEKLSWIKQVQANPALPIADLSAVIARLALRCRPGFAARFQDLKIGEIPHEVELPVSAIQLEQILSNLLDNASKFTPQGGHVKLWCALSDGWITLYVADDGPGVSLELQARLGEIGFRGHPELEGSGLGLANVKKLATAAGGLFGFNSRPGEGSTFYVTLPTTRWGRAS